MDDPDTPRCDECGSPFHRHKSPMAGLCPECAHWLYGYANCLHDMVDGRCRRCGWDGSVSVYIANLKQGRS
jgi:predicted RNA-binding Zn-ribbon protein involved in translation (DUF1610 family)